MSTLSGSPPEPGIHVLITAAGGGTRMGSGVNKLRMSIGGIPVIIRTLRTFLALPSVRRILLVVPSAEREAFRSLCAEYGLADSTDLAGGGDTRQESVMNGLEALAAQAGPDDIVLIQDGARCFTDGPTIERCIGEALRSGACCAAVRLKDTIKEADPQGLVTGTPDRARFWLVQTPQAFRFGLVLSAYRSAHEKGVTGTDDASLVEAAGHPVRLVEGSYRNIKITTPDDLLLGETLARQLRAEKGSDS